MTAGFTWRKLGLLFCPQPEGRHPKLASHAANPLPIYLAENIYRIFYSGRDGANRSSVGAVDIDILSGRIVQDHHDPFFMHGPEGSFFADGVSIGNVYKVGGVTYMLFMGWQNPPDEHWRGDIGRLIVNADLNLELDSDQPFLGTAPADPLSLSYPWVLPVKNNRYAMWYGSTQAWDAGNGEMLHVINYASSVDGQNWTREGLAVPFELGKAQAFSHPTVMVGAEAGYEMWFSYRSGNGTPYRIGYARSGDGRTWTRRDDEAGIDVAPSGWDSEMIEYPFVFDHKGERYMLYNGNGYGKTGFGLAVLEGR